MTEKIFLWQDKSEEAASLTPFLIKTDKPTPAVLVIPGGGYGCVCRGTEGISIARRFNELGWNAFVLHYRVTKAHPYPQPEEDAIRALKLIRANAREWNVIPDRVAACGFSAGGHLTAALGTISPRVPNVLNDEVDKNFSPVADGMILSYAVLCFTPWSHLGTQFNHTGTDTPTEEQLATLSPEKQVGPHTPPAFIWHTFEDGLVDYHNAFAFADAMYKFKRPCELRVFPMGPHGMYLGDKTSDIGTWPKASKDFLEMEWDIRDGRGEAHLKKYTNEFQFQCEKESYPDDFQ